MRSNLPSTPPDERERIRAALLEFCGRDTEGMIEIVAALERIEPDQPRHRARLVKLDELMGKAPVTQPSPR